VPLISPLANLLVVPAVSIGVVGVLVLLVTDLIWPLLGAFVGSLVDLWLNLVVGLLQSMGGENIPVMSTESLLEGSTGWAAVVVAYLLLVLATLAMTRKIARKLALVTLLLAINFGLGAATWNSFDRADLAITLHRVPGGIAAIVSRPGHRRADLVLTGLARKQYDLDEKILSPILARQGVDRLGRVILLSADYDALDDILRTASVHGAEHLYAAADLRSSLLDAMNAGGGETLPIEIDWFGGPEKQPLLPGYHLSRRVIQIRLRHTAVTLTGQFQSELLRPVETTGWAVLVIGERWSPTPSDWVRLHGLGYDRIVCSELAHQSTSLWPDRETESDSPPDYIWELAREGVCRLDLEN
jgi:hypothetical protein